MKQMQPRLQLVVYDCGRLRLCICAHFTMMCTVQATDAAAGAQEAAEQGRPADGAMVSMRWRRGRVRARCAYHAPRRTS
jgi:hypothetical protein